MTRVLLSSCASWSSPACVLSADPLVTLQRTPQRASLLYTAIFSPHHNPLRATRHSAASQGTGLSRLPRQPERVPANQRHLLPLLERMIGAGNPRCTQHHPYFILSNHTLTKLVVLPFFSIDPCTVLANKCPFQKLLDTYCPCPPPVEEPPSQLPPPVGAPPAAPMCLPAVQSSLAVDTPSSLPILRLAQPLHNTPSTQPLVSQRTSQRTSQRGSQLVATPSTEPLESKGPMGATNRSSSRQRRTHQSRLQQYTPSHAVAAFLWACVRRCVPTVCCLHRAAALLFENGACGCKERHRHLVL